MLLKEVAGEGRLQGRSGGWEATRLGVGSDAWAWSSPPLRLGVEESEGRSEPALARCGA